ncbi:hypothetical protein G1H11_00725 [Phytoactinopolyspora alkaliphila]|uniref:DUF2567 domain-containing protein n=1 Tax=Phytoactinopolyspora alkaliphila TaxID=1783498 RepID=A0A6N9YFY7_9ACTN|nr:hypothetical protein [Phytoactinopolyspora alkaliphila]NED93837.1 hypothetical protein [Phytoactinopolyspora alkaliphila]
MTDVAEPRRAGTKTRGRRPPMSPTRVCVEIGLASVVFGVLLGVVWYLLSPEITGQVTERGFSVPIDQARRLFDRVAVFALAGAAVGLVLGVVSGWRHRRRPVTSVLMLAAGGLAGSFVAWGLGAGLGSSSTAGEPGTAVTLPLELDAPAAVLAWPVVGVVVMTVMALFRDDRSPWVWNGGSR